VRADQLTDPIVEHGEGPVWSTRWGGLRWVDMLAGDVLSLDADGAVGRRHVGSVAAALRPRSRGGAVIAVERGFVLEDDDGTLTALPEVWTDPGVRMNEGGCDPDGRFWCGSMAYEQTPGAAAMYRLDPDGSVRQVFAGVTVSNGLAWSPDGSLAYYDDTATHRIDVFDYDSATGLTGRRPFVDLGPDGNPDGLTVDAEGGVWVALYDAGRVHHYTADGRLADVVEVPAAKVTACTFGGPDLDRLFITTSREGLEPGQDPLAGSLFAADAGVRGLPALEYAG
jgi:sugar lactone lactonase YvrE